MSVPCGPVEEQLVNSPWINSSVVHSRIGRAVLTRPLRRRAGHEASSGSAAMRRRDRDAGADSLEATELDGVASDDAAERVADHVNPIGAEVFHQPSRSLRDTVRDTGHAGDERVVVE